MYEIKTVRLKASDDLTHMHVDLVGYESGHMPGEEILIPIARIIQRQALTDKFAVRDGDELREVQAAPCPICGFTPQLKTSVDTAERRVLLDLPNE